MQDKWKVYKDFYMASNGSCLWSLWLFSKNQLLEVGLPQNWKTMALWKFTIVVLLYFMIWEDTIWIETHWNIIGWGPGNIWFHTTFKVPLPHYMILEVSCDNLWTLLLGPMSWSWLLARVWSGPNLWVI